MPSLLSETDLQAAADTFALSQEPNGPTHVYISNEGFILVQGTFQDCEDARVWHQYPNFTIQKITFDTPENI